MRDSVVHVREEPCQDGQPGARGAWQRRGDAGGKTFLCCRRKTRSACNGKSCCSFSTHHFYETTTSPSFHPTTNIAEGGTRGVGVPRGAVGPQPVSSLQGGMKRGMNGVLGENGNPLAPRPALLRGGPLLTMTALPLINTHFLIPICFSLLCNLLYQTGMGVSPTGT